MAGSIWPKATDLLDNRYGLGEALGGMILLSVIGAPDPLRYLGVPPASPLGCPWGQSRVGVRASSIAGPLQGVASGVTRKLHSTLGGAELLVDDLQSSFHRVGTEATETLVERIVEELQEQQHRHDHRDHGPHE
jgi:hypothetical protein